MIRSTSRQVATAPFHGRRATDRALAFLLSLSLFTATGCGAGHHAAGGRGGPAPSPDAEEGHGATDGARPPSAENSAGFLIRVSITPGKPGAPTETVEIRRAGGSVTIAARRESNSSVLSSTTKGIDPSAGRSVWAIVERNELRTFEPAFVEEPAWDFGERRLRIEWTRRDDSEREHHAVRWTKPLANGAAVSRLIEHLAALARDAEATLHYFPQES